MEQNKIRTYTLYAIGEIALVMIGILLALQVNNWNEENQTRSLEITLRSNLVESVRNAGLDADRFIEAEESNIKVLEHVLQNWESLSFSDVEDQFRRFQNNYFSPVFNLVSYSHFYDPETDVYNTAVSDGSISIIDDSEFLQRMHMLYNYVVPRVNELMAEEYVLGQSINDHIAIRYEHIFLTNSVVDSTLNSPELWTDKTYEDLFEEMRNDGVLKYKLAHRLELKRSRLLLVDQAKFYIDLIISE